MWIFRRRSLRLEHAPRPDARLRTWRRQPGLRRSACSGSLRAGGRRRRLRGGQQRQRREDYRSPSLPSAYPTVDSDRDDDQYANCDGLRERGDAEENEAVLCDAQEERPKQSSEHRAAATGKARPADDGSREDVEFEVCARRGIHAADEAHRQHAGERREYGRKDECGDDDQRHANTADSGRLPIAADCVHLESKLCVLEYSAEQNHEREEEDELHVDAAEAREVLAEEEEIVEVGGLRTDLRE